MCSGGRRLFWRLFRDILGGWLFRKVRIYGFLVGGYGREFVFRILVRG